MRPMVISALLLAATAAACDFQPTSNDLQRQQQERILGEATAQVGMPAIKNFRERKILKDILELRDQTGLSTYTYIWSDHGGRLVFLCESIGYGIPYATQFTAPEAFQRYYLPAENGRPATWGETRLPQADPNSLFSPSAAEGTWIQCKDPNGKDVRPVYIEPRIIVSPFSLYTAISGRLGSLSGTPVTPGN